MAQSSYLSPFFEKAKNHVQFGLITNLASAKWFLSYLLKVEAPFVPRKMTRTGFVLLFEHGPFC